jgi:hypothetical protein
VMHIIRSLMIQTLRGQLVVKDTSCGVVLGQVTP